MKLKLTLLAALAAAVIIAFLFVDLPHNWDYALPRRLKKVLAIALTGGAIAYATLIFQTMTNNRILTPNIIGLDSLYMLIQTFVIFAFGVVSLPSTNQNVNFGLTVGIMLLFVGVLYRLIFKREGNNLFFLLLVGLSLFVLRRRDPERERPFKVPFYPVVPLLFCAVCAYLLYASLVYTGYGALVGIAVLLAGIPLLGFVRKKRQLAAAE